MNKLLKTIIEEKYNIKLEEKTISTYQELIDLGTEQNVEIDLEEIVDDIYNKLEETPNQELIDILFYLSELNYANAKRNIGLCYYNGVYFEQSYEEAVKWYQLAADKGDAYAQCNLGQIYENEESEYYDLEKAKYWYKQAALQDHDLAIQKCKNLNVDL